VAKAARQPTTQTWSTLQAVHPLVIEICLSPSQAGPWLVEQIVAERVQVRWRGVRPAGASVDDFWQGSLPTLDFADNSATKLVAGPPGSGIMLGSIVLFGVEVVREEIEMLRPAAVMPVSVSSRLTAKAWVAEAVEHFPRKSQEGPGDYAARLKRHAPKDWHIRTIENEVARLAQNPHKSRD
jgi:hypothetical protein